MNITISVHYGSLQKFATSRALFYFVATTSREWTSVQSDREFKAEWIKKRRRRKKDSHSVKVLQATKFKHVEKIKNVEQEYRKKSKDIIVLLVDAKLDYHWTNGIPIRTQGENNSPFFSNSKILVIL